MINRDELAKKLGQETLDRILGLIARNEHAFVFGVQDHRPEFPAEWGGEWRLIINRNIILHFLPRYTEEMPGDGELPQFCVMPLEGGAPSHILEFDGNDADLDPFLGVRFSVSDADYHGYCAELASFFEAYEDFSFLPDTLFPDSPMLRFIRDEVLSHSVILSERDYDFSKWDL